MTTEPAAEPLQLTVQFLRQVEGVPDARGDRALYPKNWSGVVDADLGVYVVAMGYAWRVGDWPIEIEASVEVVRAIIELFRANGVEPTQLDVTREIQARLALAEQEAAASQAPPIPNAPLPAPEPAPIPNAAVPAPEPVPLAAPSKGRKRA